MELFADEVSEVWSSSREWLERGRKWEGGGESEEVAVKC